MLVCPGCGARNEPTARICDWCGRPFVVENRQITAPWLAPLSIALIAILAVATIVAALMGARGSSDDTREGSPFAAPPPASIRPAPLPEPELPPAPDQPLPLSQEEFVRIANTGGVGVFIRREPRPGAAGILAHREGVILRVVGPDTTSDGRVWRQVEDSQGVRGWTPGEFLVPTEARF